MATRAGRIAEFTINEEPPAGFDVELLCEDHNGTYVLPFPCRREAAEWRNMRTGEAVQSDVLGWRIWEDPHGRKPPNR